MRAFSSIVSFFNADRRQANTVLNALGKSFDADMPFSDFMAAFSVTPSVEAYMKDALARQKKSDGKSLEGLQKNDILNQKAAILLNMNAMLRALPNSDCPEGAQYLRDSVKGLIRARGGTHIQEVQDFAGMALSVLVAYSKAYTRVFSPHSQTHTEMIGLVSQHYTDYADFSGISQSEKDALTRTAAAYRSKAFVA